MTEIEKKALALLNECADQEVYGGWTTFDPNQTPCTRALCRAIEQNEALQADKAKLRDALFPFAEFHQLGGSMNDPISMWFRVAPFADAAYALQETER